MMKTKDWKSELTSRLEDFVDTFVVAGAPQAEVYDAIAQEIGELRKEFERDADAAEGDPSYDPEPSNDWPSA